MRATNPPLSVTACRCIGRASRQRSSLCAGARIDFAVVKHFCAAVFLSSLALVASRQAQADSLDKLADDFWSWRAKSAPFAGDDVNRIERPLTALAEALTVPAPYDEAGSREILARIENIPSILQQGAENLDKPPAPFASVAINNLDGIRERLRKMASSLAASTTLKPEKLNSACEHASDALEKYQQQLKEKLPKLPEQTALGRDAYVW